LSFEFEFIYIGTLLLYVIPKYFIPLLRNHIYCGLRNKLKTKSLSFLVGASDRIVNIRDARACAGRFLDGDCYVVPGMGHGTHKWGPLFVDHVRYFLATQLGDWRN
jgi:hypothetical protein